LSHEDVDDMMKNVPSELDRCVIAMTSFSKTKLIGEPKLYISMNI